MRNTHACASFALLIAVATILVQVPVSKPPLAYGRRSTVVHGPERKPKGGSDSFPTPRQVGSPAAKQQLVASYGRLPLSFEANQGQTDGSVKFLSRGNGYTLFLTATEAVLTLRKPQKSGVSSQEPVETQSEPRANPSRDREGAVNPQIAQITPIVIPESARSSPSVKSAQSADEMAVLRLKLVGANPNPEVAGEDELPGKSNYFLGNDPTKWRTNVPTYAKVRYKNVYPGIDLVYYGNQRELEYDFVVAPGADPRAIRLAFPSRDPRQAGADRKRAVPLRIDGQGDLVLEAEGSELRLHRPVIYQEISGARQRIGGNFVVQFESREGNRCE